jgi:3-isopropylmalate/(R)-2-methylmalate dehydratase large subunit
VCLEGIPGPWISGKDIILHLIGLIGVDGATYQSLEFCGGGIKALSLDSRLTIANMAVECGAKNGIFPADETVLSYLKERTSRPFCVFSADENAEYSAVIEIDLSRVPLSVACPHLPSKVKRVEETEGIPVDQVVIGSCTNGRMEDLRAAAAILKNRRVNTAVRCLIIPGSQEVYRRALAEGLISIFAEAGAIITMPTCGPCLGGHCGVLDEGERAIATTNRNFVGRMGHVKSEVYLTGAAAAAAAAVRGVITHPGNL